MCEWALLSRKPNWELLISCMPGLDELIPALCHSSHPPLSCASAPGKCAAFCTFCILHLQTRWGGTGVLEGNGGIGTFGSWLQRRDIHGKPSSSPLRDAGCRRALLCGHCRHQRHPICLPPSTDTQLPPGGLSPYSPPRHLYTNAAWGVSSLPRTWWVMATPSRKAVRILSLSPVTRGKVGLEGF